MLTYIYIVRTKFLYSQVSLDLVYNQKLLQQLQNDHQLNKLSCNVHPQDNVFLHFGV